AIWGEATGWDNRLPRTGSIVEVIVVIVRSGDEMLWVLRVHCDCDLVVRCNICPNSGVLQRISPQFAGFAEAVQRKRVICSLLNWPFDWLGRNIVSNSRVREKEFARKETRTETQILGEVRGCGDEEKRIANEGER
ncbi:MAG: hypothetical protein ACK42I_01105, partial [Thermomicrobium sp.]